MRVITQSIHSIQPSRPITAMESRTSTVTATVPAPVTCCVSNVTLEMSEPDVVASQAGAGMRISRSNISQRRSMTSRAATDSSANVERKDESPRTRNMPRKNVA